MSKRRRPPDPFPVQGPSQPRRQNEVTVLAAELYRGPLPPPDKLEHYERVHPGMAGRLLALHERTVAMAEMQAHHRMQLERHVIEGNTSSQRRGQWMALAIMLAATACGTMLIFSGRQPSGLAAMFVPLVAVLGVFMASRSRQDRELDRRKTELEEAARGSKS